LKVETTEGVAREDIDEIIMFVRVGTAFDFTEVVRRVMSDHAIADGLLTFLRLYFIKMNALVL
jgi:hypothetical protein